MPTCEMRKQSTLHINLLRREQRLITGREGGDGKCDLKTFAISPKSKFLTSPPGKSFQTVINCMPRAVPVICCVYFCLSALTPCHSPKLQNYLQNIGKRNSDNEILGTEIWPQHHFSLLNLELWEWGMWYRRKSEREEWTKENEREHEGTS